MLNDMTIGQYFPGQSFVHRMDPRVKIVLLFFYLVGLFAVNSPVSYGIFTVFTLFLMKSTKIPMLTMLKSVKPLMWIIIFTFIIHLFTVPGQELLKLGPFTMTLEGVIRGFFISLRLVLLLLFSSLLTFTTSPLKLTDAMETLMNPLKRVGIPAHELAMMMTIALRFVPTLIEETDKIMKAQQSRGANFSSGPLMERIRNVVPIIVPLFISAFRRADELAMAMEARCYRGGIGRTRMKELRTSGTDYMAVAISLVLFIGVGAIELYQHISF